MEKPVRLAVVGVGHLGRHHARVASTLAGVDLVGVHDHHTGRAEEIAREFGVPVIADLETVAAKAQAVILATPTVTHAELALRLIDGGCDVLIEKPIATSVREADAVLARAREKKTIVQVGHVERYNPAVSAAMAMIREPLFVEVHRLSPFTRRSLDVDVVLDLMIHDLQIVRALAGTPVTEVRAAGVPVLTPRIDIANARLVFAGGCVANLTASRVSNRKVRKFRVFAPSLYVSIDMQARTVQALRLSREGGEPEIVPVEVPVAPVEPLALEIEDFIRSVRQRATPLVSGEVGRDALALAEEVLSEIVRHRRAFEEVRK